MRVASDELKVEMGRIVEVKEMEDIFGVKVSDSSNGRDKFNKSNDNNQFRKMEKVKYTC